MSEINIKEINKYYGSNHIIKDVSLDIKSQSFTVLVGPSGCGKSTILRMIAGLEDINSGTIAIDGTVVNDLAPKQRNIAMVFQSYALYPHMTVFNNMAFGLKLEKRSKDEIEERVHEAAKILQIEDYLQRKPKQLSGGQRQRVAIGRAITRKPKVFLFDEPLSNLDAALRVQMRVELAKLHDQLDATMIYVTHDQTEAMSLGDKVVIIKDGVIQQIGKPEQIFHEPENVFVAEFIGHPKMNILDTENSDLGVYIEQNKIIGKDEINIPKSDFRIGIRPADIIISDTGIPVKVESYDYQGSSWLINTYLGEQKICVELKELSKKEESLCINIPPEKIMFFDCDSGNLIK